MMESRAGEYTSRVATVAMKFKAAWRGVRGILGVFAVLCLGWSSGPDEASAQLPPDEDWRTLTTEHFRVTFPRHLEALGRRAAVRAEAAYGTLATAFPPAPGGAIDLVVTDHVDISNGYASVIPYKRIVVYARPPVDDLALGYFDEWMELVVTHELAHIFHLDRTGALGKALRGVFGRVPASWPFFPSLDVPRWTVEGLATWYESSLTHAGRAHGSYHDMVLRTAILEDRFEDLDQASGMSPEWPGGERSYVYGSLFFRHLLEKYGEERMGAFADAVAGQWIPYRLNAAAKDAFGVSFSQEWRAWREALAEEADVWRGTVATLGDPTRGEMLTEGARVAWYPRVSRDGEHVAFLRSDGRSDTQIRIMDLDGGGERALTRVNGIATFDWAPDGSIVFSQLELADPYRAYADLYRVDRSGGVRRITRGGRLSQPSVAPDGRTAVAVAEGEGTSALVRVDLADGSVETLVAPRADVHWGFPSVSPDGRWIAATRWTPGAHLDVVVLDVDGRERMEVTADRAMDLGPTWSPGGDALFWTSDRTGSFNALTAEVDPVARSVGEVRLATNSLTGTAYPAPDPGGRWLYYSGYHADGWEVERIALAGRGPLPSAPAPPAEVAGPAGGPESVEDGSGAGEIPVQGYSSGATLLPRYWQPIVDPAVSTPSVMTPDITVPARRVMGPGFGAAIGGQDLVGRHGYAAFVRYRPEGSKTDGGATYSYAGLGNPVMSVGYRSAWDEDGVRLGRSAPGAPIDVLYALERERTLSGGVTLRRSRWRSALSLTVSGAYAWKYRELLDDTLEPSTAYRLNRPEEELADVAATLAFSTARGHAFQLGGSGGMSAFVRARTRTHRNLPDTLVGARYWDESVDDVIGRLVVFKALGGPGYAPHVLALRVSGGSAVGPGAHGGYFEAGGASGMWEGLTGLSLFGGPSYFFPVRGYPEGIRTGRRVWSGSLEYRFPLFLVNQGMGTVPLHLDRLAGSLFLDAGNAWGPVGGPVGYDSPMGSSVVSGGAEVTGQFLTFWVVPLQVRGGVAFPFEAGAPPRYYVRLGLSF
ncbi:MAG: hypothetical protein OEZ37_04900 [Gemmatimonadota bacterium]|nr:hypothetical protein [Gemmatimonadota bacterium]